MVKRKISMTADGSTLAAIEALGIETCRRRSIGRWRPQSKPPDIAKLLGSCSNSGTPRMARSQKLIIRHRGRLSLN